MASINIHDVFLHIPIFPLHKYFPHFAVEDNHFQLVALPYGLAMDIQVFKKVLAPVFLRYKRIHVLGYLDALLLRETLWENLHQTIHIFQGIDWIPIFEIPRNVTRSHPEQGVSGTGATCLPLGQAWTLSAHPLVRSYYESPRNSGLIQGSHVHSVAFQTLEIGRRIF